jgi:tetraacyldisaccharide 4'-kinase
MNPLLKILLYPVSLIYGSIVWIRNKLYDWGVFTSKEFAIPTISVGNLSMGGTGKTPHVEYLIDLLKDQYNIATLSRGYKRKTTGFKIADKNTSFLDIGDEPAQYAFKHRDIIVAVDEKRSEGISKLTQQNLDLDIIILDDAFQHRQVKPGINILITDANALYINDYPIPCGRLREFRCGANRADIIIVSKTSNILSPIDKRRIEEELKPRPYQKVFFTYLEYGTLTPVNQTAKNTNLNPEEITVLLLTGIANPSPLLYKLKRNFKEVHHLPFPDHHIFSEKDVQKIKQTFNHLYGNNKIIITTEKDLMRLSLPEIISNFEEIPLFYQPIKVAFHGKDQQEFNEEIIKYVTANSRNSVLLKDKNKRTT